MSRGPCQGDGSIDNRDAIAEDKVVTRTVPATQEDPVKDGMNWYVYCANDPVNNVDPSGTISIGDGIYSSAVQKQLLNYTENYYNAYFFEKTDRWRGMKSVHARANELRIDANKRSWWDTKAMQMENNMILASAKAKSLGFEEGSLEYGVTFLMYTQALNDIDERAQERYNQQLMFFALFSLSDLNKYGKQNYATNDNVIKAKNDISDWLGKDTRVITNSNGDKVFMSADGTRRVRFDLQHPAQHEFPHAHVEELIKGSWQKSGPIFPKDISR